MTETKKATSTRSAGANGARRAAHPGLVLLVIAGAQLMVVLDGTIVNIALPSMGAYFDKSQADMTWALNAYSLAFGGLLLLGGRMATSWADAGCSSSASRCPASAISPLLRAAS